MSNGTIWMDGSLVDWDQATVHVSAHGLHYGIGFFEGLRCYPTPQGPAIFRLTDHLARLARSAATYLVTLPYSIDELAEACRQVVRANHLTECYLRPVVFLGAGHSPLAAPYHVAIIATEHGPLTGPPKQDGVKATIASFHRMPPHVIPPAAKATGQYLNAYLAQTEALTSGYDEAILLNTQGHVTDGWAHNIFTVRNHTLYTPPISSGALEGIVRDTIITLATEAGIPHHTEPLTRTDLYHADECFLTGTAAGIIPVTSIDHRPIANSKPGPITQQLTTQYHHLTTGHTNTHPQWRDLIDAPPALASDPAQVAVYYRRRLRKALATIDADEVASWERAGQLPRQAIADLAQEDVFHERWAAGATDGLPHVVAMAEETAEISGGLALATMGHSEVFIGALQWLSTNDWQRSLLTDALAGRAVGCFGATEPHGGSELSAIQTTATRTPEGWQLHGCKRYVSNLGSATHILVVARVAGSDARDLALFLAPLDNPGVHIRGFFDTVGLQSCDVGEVEFDTRLPAEALLGAEGMGLLYASRLLQFERLSICAQLLTATRLAVGLAGAYARRRSLGEEVLLDRQVIRHRLARARARLATAEAGLRELIARGVAGRPFAHEVAELKLVSSELAEQVTDECLQVFGARGYTTNFPLQRWWRDVRLARIGGGADEVLAEVVAGRLRQPEEQFDQLLDRLEATDLPRPRDGAAKVERPALR